MIVNCSFILAILKSINLRDCIYQIKFTFCMDSTSKDSVTDAAATDYWARYFLVAFSTQNFDQIIPIIEASPQVKR